MKTVTVCGVPIHAAGEAVDAFTLFDTGNHGGDEMVAFIRETSSMKSFLDVGALFGVFSLVFAATPGKTSYALEPSPWAYPTLLEQCDLNPGRDVRPQPIFAGDTAGRRVACGRDWMHVVAGHEGEPFEATETTIDSWNINIDCMKIDVEGYECAVLRGAQETIRRDRPVIFLECHPDLLALHGETRESLLAILTRLGYRTSGFDNATPFSTRGICYPLSA
jgi:FkbM family methyltransferase